MQTLELPRGLRKWIAEISTNFSDSGDLGQISCKNLHNLQVPRKMPLSQPRDHSETPYIDEQI
jgi:hypothetical protein